jgi:hypothetical protein
MGNAQRLLESLWAIFKGLESCWEMPNTRCQPTGEEAELPSGCLQKYGNFNLFPMKCFFSVNINKKSKTR